MRLLLDTNVVLRTVNRDDALYGLVSGAVQTLLNQGHECVLVPQVVYEFWAVASRPAQVNGWGWSPSAVRTVINDLTQDWTLLHDTPEVFERWLELVTTHIVAGKQVHDARLAAAALAYGLDYLLTLNGDNFKRFEVQTVHPRDVSA